MHVIRNPTLAESNQTFLFYFAEMSHNTCNNFHSACRHQLSSIWATS